uniref:POZ/BTB and AT hook containing zinc finger 1 n=1 Tax=Bubo bubo TaxID=30461 RepID=A0A8C0EPU9_BUBBB
NGLCITSFTCNASFATRDRLRSHLACHEDKVPCQVCGKYLRAAYMADHLKKHSEGPSNFCTICNRGLQAPGVHPEWGSSVPLRQDLWHQRQETLLLLFLVFNLHLTSGEKMEKICYSKNS